MKWLLIIFVVITVILDIIFTLLGQSPKYWENYQLAVDGNPLALFFLLIHPLLFLFFSLIWVSIVTCLIKVLRFPWFIFLGIAVILGHLWGSVTWVPSVLTFLKNPWLEAHWGWYISIIYIILLSVLFGAIIYLFYPKSKS